MKLSESAIKELELLSFKVEKEAMKEVTELTNELSIYAIGTLNKLEKLADALELIIEYAEK